MLWTDQEFSDLIDAIDSSDHIDAIESTELTPEVEIRSLLLDRALGMLARGIIIVIPSLLGAFFVAGTLDALAFAPFLPVLLATAGLFVAIQALLKQL